MSAPRIILDTNVIVAAVRSKIGASFRLLSLFRSGIYRLAISVPLVLEYEDVLLRQQQSLPLTREQIGDILDQICNAGDKYDIPFLWRPILPDPGDDHILELAVAAQVRQIVTFNLKDFVGIDKFDIRALTPRAMLRELGELP